MEVHHHAHVENLPAGRAGKRFKEYFLEFIMIFLAVTLGFFAENIRESFVNKEKEHHYIQNLRLDLGNDIIQLDSMVSFQNLWHQHLDSALKIPIESLTDINEQDSFLYHFFPFYSLIPVFEENDNTISQLKSGGFNIFRNKATIDSISRVYNNRLKFNNDFFLSTYWDAAHQAQKIMRLPQPATNFTDTILFKFRKNYRVFTQYNKEETVQLYNKIGNANGTLITLIMYEQVYRKSMVDLLNYLDKTYPSQ
ncbi:MAG: hypothetical protein B6D37_01985 [Sphingobacteriales bacterium UTBCD1]|jgi:hypothetical protein|nr:MAG: hypothetical protein B6D37_01985 [Sphingobacteriales bacterium UTBCD1]